MASSTTLLMNVSSIKCTDEGTRYVRRTLNICLHKEQGVVHTYMQSLKLITKLLTLVRTRLTHVSFGQCGHYLLSCSL